MLTLAGALFTALITALLSLLVPVFARRFPHLRLHRANSLWLYAAAVCLAMSVFLPDIHISNQTHTFQQHFVGGGMYTACLFLYARQLFGWRLGRVQTLALFYAWVSAFGVAVELAEFLGTQSGIIHAANADTDWDLLANTLGALIVLAFYTCAVSVRQVQAKT